MSVKPQIDPFTWTGLSRKWEGSSWWASCSFNWTLQQPPYWSNVSWSSCQDFVDLFFPSTPPTANIRINPNDRYYEVWDTANPVVEARWQLWQNPQWNLTLLRINKNGSSLQEWTNPTSNTWYSTNDTVSITWTGEIVRYQSYVEDDQWRSDNSWIITIYWTYPWFATTSNITTLTKQSLDEYKPAYFDCVMVAESDTEKQKADFEENIVITWVEVHDEESDTWSRLWWSKAQSLVQWDVSNVTHTVQWNTVNYKRYTHNKEKIWARRLRFRTD